MKTKFFKDNNILIYIVIPIFYLVGIGLHLNKHSVSLALKITEYFLFLMGAFILFLNLKRIPGRKFTVFITLSFLVTFFLEVLGVKTGIIFGDYYTYGDLFQVKVLEVPLVIGLNWVLLALAAASVSVLIFPNGKILASVLAGSLIVCLDYLIEPVAIKLGYWTWQNNSIPLMNYITWFSITCILTLLMHQWALLKCKKIMLVYLITNFIYFAALNLFY